MSSSYLELPVRSPARALFDARRARERMGNKLAVRTEIWPLEKSLSDREFAEYLKLLGRQS